MCNYNLFKKTTHFIAMQLYLFMVTRVGFMWLRIYRFRVSWCFILGRLEVVWFLKDDIFIHHIISCAMHFFLFHKYVICSTWCYIRFETHTHTRRNMCYMWYENSLDFYWSRFNSNFHHSLWTRKLWGFKTIFEVKFVVSSILLLLIESSHLFRAFPFRSELFSFN